MEGPSCVWEPHRNRVSAVSPRSPAFCKACCFSWGVTDRKSHVTKPAHETVAGRWAHHVGRHPLRYAIVSFVALCAIAVPALSMRIGTPDDGNAGAGKTERIAYDTLANAFGRGFNGPIVVVVDVPTATDRSAVQRVHDALVADPGVASVAAPTCCPQPSPAPTRRSC